MTDYLAKAREMCPKKKDEKETCKNCADFKTHGSTYCLDCTVETQVYSYNQALSLCLPIVADLLKRVDELKEGVIKYPNQILVPGNLWLQKDKRIAELEKEVKRLRSIVDKIPLNIYNRMIA